MFVQARENIILYFLKQPQSASHNTFPTGSPGLSGDSRYSICTSNNPASCRVPVRKFSYNGLHCVRRGTSSCFRTVSIPSYAYHTPPSVRAIIHCIPVLLRHIFLAFLIKRTCHTKTPAALIKYSETYFKPVNYLFAHKPAPLFASYLLLFLPTDTLRSFLFHC